MSLLLTLFTLLTCTPPIAEARTTQVDSDSGQIILYVFTGSDWCSRCNRFEKNVMKDTLFNNTLQKNNIQIRLIDFPQRKKLTEEEVRQNGIIADKYGFSGNFPTFILAHENAKSFRTFYYVNENATIFLETLLNELRKLNE